ncbi:MAG: hypothetical protein JKX99_01665 [Robiginitomaculum sp.]|nr:hypothetical protein [Robiginitomaculum sp.]
MSSSPKSREIIFETIRCGDSLKISAIDMATGIEVSIIAPPQADESYTQTIAARKLEVKLRKKAGIEPEKSLDDPDDPGHDILA